MYLLQVYGEDDNKIFESRFKTKKESFDAFTRYSSLANVRIRAQYGELWELSNRLERYEKMLTYRQRKYRDDLRMSASFK